MEAGMSDEARTPSVWIDRSYDEVYDFLAVPGNFPQWATGLGEVTGREGDVWRVKTPEGAAKVRFSERNDYGVVDHDILLDDGTEIPVAMRAIGNGTGTEVLLTARRRGRPAEVLAADVEWVERDLATLKMFLESEA
ncbi:polyketide cyclase [Fodinicola feengrottensis]|uniref:Polyketide cyclase n=3 Tax=Fodinicola feengrottensis TaxID=435914 RepID=A0ABN2HT46_9ACTN